MLFLGVLLTQQLSRNIRTGEDLSEHSTFHQQLNYPNVHTQARSNGIHFRGTHQVFKPPENTLPQQHYAIKSIKKAFQTEVIVCLHVDTLKKNRLISRKSSVIAEGKESFLHIVQTGGRNTRGAATSVDIFNYRLILTNEPEVG